MHGQWHYGLRTEPDHEQAKQFFQRAVEIDPQFLAPYMALARTYLDDTAGYGTRSLEDAAELAANWARKAIAIDPNDADARAMVALTAFVVGKVDEAREQVALAKTNNPNSPLAILIEAHVLLFTGQPVQAQQGLTACLRFDPRGPYSFWVMHQFTISYYFARDYSRAVEVGRRTVALHPESSSTWRWLAAALGQLGRREEALAALRKAIDIAPRSFEFYIRRRPLWHRPEDYDHMLDGLRKAGWKADAATGPSVVENP